MSSHQKYVMSISCVAFVAFLVLLGFFHSISPVSVPVETGQAGLEAYRSQKDILVTPGGAGLAPDILPTDPVLGTADARVTIIVFSDFQCPYCAQTHTLLRELYQTYQKDVRIVWKDFPLPAHLFAKTAAFAGRCAAVQGKFWEFVDAVFPRLSTSDPLQINDMLESVISVGASLGIPEDRFRGCIQSQRYADEVGDNLSQGLGSDIDGVPYLFINNTPYSGQPTRKYLETLIQNILNS